MPKRYEYALEVAISPARVYEVLTDIDRWRASKVYGAIRWVEGTPWQPDSVRMVETLVPFRARHRQRILKTTPGELVEVLSHGMGYTNHTQILLAPTDAGGASIRYLIDIE